MNDIKKMESQIYLNLALESLKITMDDLDNEWIARGRIKSELEETIKQLNLARGEK